MTTKFRASLRLKASSDNGESIKCKRLLIGCNIFVKDLSAKVLGKNYMRFAVRAAEDNDKLLATLRKELSASK